MIEALDRYTAQLDEEAPQPGRHFGLIVLMARWRWFWIPPLYAVALLLLLFVTLSRGASTAQLMYGNF